MKRVIVALAFFAVLAPGAAVADRATFDSQLGAQRSSCPGANDRHAPEPKQERAMRCLIDQVRASAGAQALRSNRALERAAGGKVGDVVRCGFTHTACGNPADEWLRRTGYLRGGSWRWGENLARATGAKADPRSIVRAWLDSPPHRRILLAAPFEHLGLGLKSTGRGAFWVLEVGCHGC